MAILRGRDYAVIYDGKVSVPKEWTRLEVQEPYKVFNHDVTFVLRVEFLFEAFAQELFSLETAN